MNKTTKSDISYSIAKGSIGSIPVVGALASELLGLIVAPPLEKRRIAWMNDVGEKLKELEERKGLDIMSLQENEQFIDVVAQATTLALKTSEKEKIKAFKNTIINTAVGEAPDQILSQIFLSHLDRFTSWHIQILQLFDDPKQWFDNAKISVPNYISGSLSKVLKEAFPEMWSGNNMAEIIWDDLKLAGFHNSTGLKTMLSGDLLETRTTVLGRKFIKFISDHKL